MLLYVVCTAGEFVWNEGGVVQLPAPFITLCDFLKLNLNGTQGKEFGLDMLSSNMRVPNADKMWR